MRLGEGRGRLPIISRKLKALKIRRIIYFVFVLTIGIGLVASLLTSHLGSSSAKASLETEGGVVLSGVTQFSSNDDPIFHLKTEGLITSSKNKTAQGELTDENQRIKASLEFNSTEVETKPQITALDTGDQFEIKALKNSSFRPGKYQLNIDLINRDQVVQSIVQDFTWGVLALNLNYSTYKVGETANIGIGVLNDGGKTVCDAKVWLKIIDPQEQATELSTENKTIVISDTCDNANITNIPDYQASYMPAMDGIYRIELKAETKNGVRNLTESFEVLANPDFIINRHDTSMRIVPSSIYTVNINILANKDLSGGVKEKVPASFDISDISSGGQIIDKNETTQTIAWPANLNAGDSIELSYVYDAQDISPEFYLLGPIEIWQPVIEAEGGEVRNTTVFTEPRAWQIASDSPGHTFDNKAQILDARTNPVAANYTCGAGATLLVLSLSTTTGTTRTGGAPTYNGNTLTQVATALGDTGGEGTAELWYLVNPPTGSALSVSVPNTGAGYITVIISSYKAAAGYTSALDATNQAYSTSSTNPTVSVTSHINGDVIVDSLFTGYTSPPSANNRVLLYQNDTGNESNGAQYYLQATAATAAMSWTRSTADDWQLVAAAFKEVVIPTISGTVYTSEDKGANVVSDGTSIGLSVNGGTKYTTTTASGVFTFSKPVNANDTITLFIDTNYVGNLVTQAVNSSANITGLEMYTNKVALRDEIPTTGKMTNALLDIADNLGDADILFTVASSNVDFTGTAGIEVWIESGYNYTPGGTITAHDLELAGTGIFEPAANAVTVTGSYKAVAGSTLTTSGTVTFSAPSGTETLITGGTDANHDFTNLTKSSGGVLQLSANGISISGTLIISTSTTFDINGQNLTLGTLNNSGTLKLQGGETTVAITTMDTDSGTVEYVGTDTYTSLKAGNNYYNLTINNASGTWTLGANLIVYGVFNLNAGTFNASNRTIELAGGGTPFIKTGTFNKDTSIVQYTANVDTNITAANYYNLELIDPPTPQQHSSVNVASQPVSTTHKIFNKIYNYGVNQLLKSKQIAVNSYNYFRQLFGKERIAAKEVKKTEAFAQTIHENIPLDELQTAINAKDNQLTGTDNFKAKLGSQETYFEFKDDQQKQYWIKSNLINAENRQASEISREKLKWQDVLPGIDIEQKLYENRIKESIIVKDEKAPTTLSFKLDFSPGMEAKAENGKIVFTDKNDQTVLVEIEKPVAKDQNNQEFQFKYTLLQDTLKLEPAEELKNVAYPLDIDPSYTVKTGVDTNATEGNSQRKLARDSNGKLYCVYYRMGTSTEQIYMASSTDGGQNWNEELITEDGSYWQSSPSIAIDSNNYLHVVWHGTHAGSTYYYQIRYREYTTSWQTIQNLTSESNNSQFYPSIAIDSNNYLHVVWHGSYSGSTTYSQIRYIKNITGTTTWETIENLTSESYDQKGPSIAIDSNNYLHVVWYGPHAGSTTYDQIRYIKNITGTTTWETIENLTSEGYHQYSPAIAIDSNDYLHVVWYGPHAGSTTYLQIRYIKNITGTTTWETIENLTSESYDQKGPSIAIDSNNYLHVVWYGAYSGSTIYMQLRYIKNITGTTTWETIENLTSGSVGQTRPNLIWANYPTISGKKPNRTIDGYAFIWMDGTTVKYYASSDLVWESFPPTYTLSSGTFDIDGYFTNGNGVDTMTVTAATYNPIIDLEGNMTTTANCTFIASDSAAFNIAGDWSNSGTFIAGSSTITFDGTNEATVSGSTTFNNLTMNTTTDGAKAIKFTAGTTQTISGTWTLDGDVGKVLTLKSTTDTSAWEFVIPADINPAGDYIDVRDSQNTTNAYRITAGANTNDLTNNDPGWLFPSANTAPTAPISLVQKKVTGGATLATGDWTNETQVQFTASATDPDASDTLYLCVEKDTLATAFSSTNGGDLCGIGVAYSGTAVTVTVTITGLTDATEYHWQAQVKDTAAAYSAFVGYGANTENPPTNPAARDFGTDTTAPTGGTVSDGTGVDVGYNNGSLSSLSANWTGVVSTASGLNKYEYAIGTTVGGIDTKTWTNNNTSTSVTDSGLTLRTGQTYYFTIRTTDNATNVSTAINSNGQAVAPTLTFGYFSGASITFDVLNSGNSWTDSAKTTVLRTSTNAYNGYVIKARAIDELRSPSSFIAHFRNGGLVPNSAPETWSGTGFGYTTSDSDLIGPGDPDRFTNGGPKYAGWVEDGPGDPVATNPNVAHTPIVNEDVTITYRVTGDATTVASTYATTIVYTCIPQY